MVIGASGRSGQLMRKAGGAAPVIWASRRGGPGLTRWRPGDPLPKLRAALVLSAVTTGRAEGYPENIRIARETAAALAAAGVPLCIYASTQAVYGRTAEHGATEGDAPCAPSAYGASKLAAERQFALALSGTRSRGVILRLGNIAGADRLGRQVARGLPLRLDRFDDGPGPERSYLTAPCLLRLALGVMEAHSQGADLPLILNAAAPEPVAMAEILQAAGLPFDWRRAPEGAARRITMSMARLAGLFPDLLPKGDPAILAAALLPVGRQGR
ncbi:NAD-dependent epimerase/dehydratase family protein [Falsigemmobacter faecalis]|nr:NAD-dependent epimerase/dehydratase family protein [Falsigemmobacter faecalis]